MNLPVSTSPEFATPEATAAAGRRVRRSAVRPVSSDYALQMLRTSLPLVLADTLSVVFSVATGAAALFLLGSLPVNHYPAVIGLVLSSVFVANTCFGLYPAAGLHPIRELQRLTVTSTLVNGILFVAAFAQLNSTSPYLPLFIVIWLIHVAITMPLRCFIRHYCRDQKWWGFDAVLIGCGTNPQDLAETLQRERRRGVRLTGFFSSNVEYWDVDFQLPENCAYLGPLDAVSDHVHDNKVYWAFVPQSSLNGRSLRSLCEEFRFSFPNLVVINDQHVLPGLWNETIEFENGVSGLRLREELLLTYPRLMKRMFDAIASGIGIMLLSPIFVAIAAVVRCTSKGPVIYGHKRIGIGGMHFKAWKFRTMVMGADKILEKYLNDHPELRAEWQKTQKLKHDPRITWVGKFLRASSLDELPQLWNVLKGEMSLVGPRPIVDNEVEKYADVYASYLRVKPGITGLWQISGRNDTTYEQRVSFDEYYVSNWSLWMDLYILGRTLKTVLLREGAY